MTAVISLALVIGSQLCGCFKLNLKLLETHNNWLTLTKFYRYLTRLYSQIHLFGGILLVHPGVFHAVIRIDLPEFGAESAPHRVTTLLKNISCSLTISHTFYLTSTNIFYHTTTYQDGPSLSLRAP